MKKPGRNKIFAVIIILSLVSFLSIAAYEGIIKKSGKTTQAVTGTNNTDYSNPLKLYSGLSNRYYFNNREVYQYIDISANPADEPDTRTPLNIAVVIDRSGSMNDSRKLSYVIEAVNHVIDELKTDDYISLTAYSDDAEVLFRSAQIEDKYRLKKIVSGITAGGYTNLSGGMLEGYRQVSSTFKKGYVNRVLLLSDGLANRGITELKKLADIVKEKSEEENITLSSFGVGNDFNEDLMTDIAEYGGGNYYYIKNPSDITDIFGNELNRVKQLAGQGVKLTVSYPSEYMTVSRVFGYPYEISGDEITIDLKELYAGGSKTVMIKYVIRQDIDRVIGISSSLVYSDVSSGFREVREYSETPITPVKSKSEFEKGADINVKQRAVVFESNYIMETALKESDRGNYTGAQEKLKSGVDFINRQTEELPASPEMKKQLELMKDYNEEIRGAETKSEEEMKEIQKKGKFDNYNARKNNE